MTYIYALALICLSSVAPADCTRETAIAVTPINSVDPVTPAGCAMISLHVMAGTALPGRGRYVKIICEERHS